jgi:hypothetical protein
VERAASVVEQALTRKTLDSPVVAVATLVVLVLVIPLQTKLVVVVVHLLPETFKT